MVRLAAELLLLLGLLLLTLHITVLRGGGGEPQGPAGAANHSQRQVSAVRGGAHLSRPRRREGGAAAGRAGAAAGVAPAMRAGLRGASRPRRSGCGAGNGEYGRPGGYRDAGEGRRARDACG